MPKKKKKKENWFGIGFLVGALFGGPVYFAALNNQNPVLLELLTIRVAVVAAFVLGWVLTLCHAYRNKPLIDPLLEGLIAGFGFIATGVDWYLHGIPFL